MPFSHTASSFDALGHGKPSQNSDDLSGHCGLLGILKLALGWLTIEFFCIVLTGDQLRFQRVTPIALLCLSLLRLVLDASHISLLSLHPCLNLPGGLTCFLCSKVFVTALALCSLSPFPWSLVSLPPWGVLASPLQGVLVSLSSCQYYLVSTPVLFTPLWFPQTVNFIKILFCLSLLFSLVRKNPL